MESKTLKILAVLLGIVLVTGQAFSAQEDPAQEPMVRIALLKSAKAVEISIRGQYQIENLITGAVLKQGRTLRQSVLELDQQWMRVGDDRFPTQRLRVSSNKDITIYYKDKSFRYRGHIDFVANKDRTLLIINEVGLEEYVKGVLYHEVDYRWPSEALKVQAVAARSYVLYQMQQTSKNDFDVTGDIYSQMYGGRSAERYRTNLAVEKTEGKVLIYSGKMFPAYYSSMCAGHTENVSELWKEIWPPLKGVEDKFCLKAPHSRWAKNFRSSDVQAKLNANGYKIGPIENIRILERNKSGRIKTLQISSREGQVIKIPGRKFRDLIGPNVIKSNNYEIVMKGWFFDLIGKGWGHGVGMCQWGAMEMAKQRYSYDEILKFYYPGAELADHREAGLNEVK